MLCLTILTRSFNPLCLSLLVSESIRVTMGQAWIAPGSSLTLTPQPLLRNWETKSLISGARTSMEPYNTQNPALGDAFAHKSVAVHRPGETKRSYGLAFGDAY